MGGTPAPPQVAITMCRLETDASLNTKRFKTLDDGAVLPFAGGGVVLRTISMRHIAHAPVPLGFVRTTNEAECRALIAGLRLARAHGAKTVSARTDKLPLVEFVNGREEFERPEMVELGQELKAEAAALSGLIVRWAPSWHKPTRGDGVPAADFLARQAAGLLGARTYSPRRRGRRRVSARVIRARCVTP